MEKTIAEIKQNEVNSNFKKLIERQSEESIEINNRVEDLKKSLWELEQNHHYQVYLVLKEILKLRRMQINGYDKRMLSNERGIPYSREQVRYFFMFDYMSEKTKLSIESGKLKASTYLCIVRRDKRYRQEEIQDKILESLDEGKISMEDIAFSTSYIVLRKTNAIEPMKDADKKALKTIYAVNTLRKNLLKHKDFLFECSYKNKLLTNFDNLQKVMEDIRQDLNPEGDGDNE